MKNLAGRIFWEEIDLTQPVKTELSAQEIAEIERKIAAGQSVRGACGDNKTRLKYRRHKNKELDRTKLQEDVVKITSSSDDLTWEELLEKLKRLTLVRMVERFESGLVGAGDFQAANNILKCTHPQFKGVSDSITPQMFSEHVMKGLSSFEKARLIKIRNR